MAEIPTDPTPEQIQSLIDACPQAEHSADTVRVGAYSDSDGHFGVALAVSKADFVVGGEAVVLLTSDEMVEMAEHLLANSRRLRARIDGRDDGSDR